VFYVWDLNGQKIDEPDQVAEIKAAILGRLPQMTNVDWRMTN
jgi:hypothetical protein